MSGLIAKDETKAQQLCRVLEDDIVKGRLLPGMQLEELVLANRFKCSRTPVREALHLLISSEMVERIPHKGVCVATMSPKRLTLMFEAVAEIEAMCGRLCILRASAPERREFVDLHHEMRDVVHKGDAEEYASFNRKFHNLIYMGTKNDILAEMSRQARRRIAPYRRVQFNDLNRLIESHKEHEDFVRAVESGNAQRGYEVLYEHIMAAQDMALAYLKSIND
ncbi:MAG: GntR family transcriptional regulator [Legionella sp.]|nr:GntR family transcriptional regulator [Legionella sp.]